MAQKAVDIPGTGDPEILARISEHLLEVQMGSLISHSVTQNCVPGDHSSSSAESIQQLAAEQMTTSTNNSGSGDSHITPRKPADSSCNADIQVDIERSNQIAEQPNQLVERSNQITERSNQMVEKAIQPTERSNQLFE
ncbi:unnamed protein product [Rhizoctonia solani]|uniref:Uncharacterized protein n=1 Tax=Rhizoctonia solani TaxID=456999 RepID=A0A8H3H1V7_9AGAM|nr:unnamed protein product [Rhizoctonia solani]